jgi:hypothetical protein
MEETRGAIDAFMSSSEVPTLLQLAFNNQFVTLAAAKRAVLDRRGKCGCGTQDRRR